MDRPTKEQFSSLAIDHLGLVADKIADIGLIDLIDERLPVSSSAKTTMGERVAAMILNGLFFIDNRLYMFPEFLTKRPVVVYLVNPCKQIGLMMMLWDVVWMQWLNTAQPSCLLK